MKNVKKIYLAMVGTLTSALVIGCNNTGTSTDSGTNNNSGLQTNTLSKYDNDKVKGVWAVANGYDGGSINPNLNMLAQNNTDAIMSFVGCDDVDGSEKAQYNLKAFSESAISYASVFPSIYQEYANMTTGGEYLMDKLTNQPTLQTIKFEGKDYYGDNKKQCYYAIINKDNKDPMYVKLTLDTKKISTYDPTGTSPWVSKPLEEMQSASKETKSTVHKLIDPSYTIGSNAQLNQPLFPEHIDKLVRDFIANSKESTRRNIIREFLFDRLLAGEVVAVSNLTYNALIRSLAEAVAKGYFPRASDLLEAIGREYTVSHPSEFGAFKISNNAWYNLYMTVQKGDYETIFGYQVYTLGQEYLSRQVEGHVKFIHNPMHDDDLKKLTTAFDKGEIPLEAEWLRARLVNEVDKSYLAELCNRPNVSNGVCTPLEDAIKDANRAKVQEMSLFGKQAMSGTDVPGRTFNEVSQLEAKVSTIAETRGIAGGLVTKNALKDIFHFMPRSSDHPDVNLSGLDVLLSLGGGPISVAAQLVISEAIAWATHSVTAPQYDIRVTGMKWEAVDENDVKRWNGNHKGDPIAANSNVVTLTDSSFNNMVRVSYKDDPKEPRDNQLNYTLTIDPITTPFVRAVQDKPDPWLGNVSSHMGESYVDFAKLRSSDSQEGSAVMKLTLNQDSDKYQDNDVYKFIFQQLGMDAYIPQYLPAPNIGSTIVTSFGGKKLDLNNLQAKPSISQSGLALTKISPYDEALFISPGTMVKLGLTIPKSSNQNDPSVATRLMASYDAINPQTGAIIAYGQIGSQSMFNALTESKDSLPLLMTAFDCSFPYEAGKTCNATFAMSSQNIKTKGDGKLYIQDAAGDYRAIPIHMGYSIYPQPWKFDVEAGSKHKMILTLSDVSSDQITKIELTGDKEIIDSIKAYAPFYSCADSIKNKLSYGYTSAKRPIAINSQKPKAMTSLLENKKGTPQTSNVYTVTPPQCNLGFDVRTIEDEGEYPITITTTLKDGTKDVQVIPVEVKEPI